MRPDDPRRWHPTVDVAHVRVLLRSLSAICDGVAEGLEPVTPAAPARLPEHDRDEHPIAVARLALERRARRTS